MDLLVVVSCRRVRSCPSKRDSPLSNHKSCVGHGSFARAIDKLPIRNYCRTACRFHKSVSLEFVDGSTERMYIPAEIWRRNPHRVSKLLVFEKGRELKQIIVDPNWETADADLENNYYPRRMTPSRVEEEE